MVGQPVQGFAVGCGLRAYANDAAGGVGGDAIGASAGGNDPAQAAQNRGGDRAQHAEDPGDVEQRVSVSGAVCAGGVCASDLNGRKALPRCRLSGCGLGPVFLGGDIWRSDPPENAPGPSLSAKTRSTNSVRPRNQKTVKYWG